MGAPAELLQDGDAPCLVRSRRRDLERLPAGRSGVAVGVHLTGAAGGLDAQPLAYNQGFYNLFLAIVTAVGVALVGSHREAAVALLCAGTGSMLAAALDAHHLRPLEGPGGAPAVQGLLPGRCPCSACWCGPSPEIGVRTAQVMVMPPSTGRVWPVT